MIAGGDAATGRWWGAALGAAAAAAILVAATVGIYVDARRRYPARTAALWAVGSLVLGPVVLPLYVWRMARGPGEGPDGDRAAPVILPWVRAMSYLGSWGWASLVPIALIGATMVLLERVHQGLSRDVAALIIVQSSILGTFVIAWTVMVRYLVDRRPLDSLGTAASLRHTVAGQLAGAAGGAVAAAAVASGLAALGVASLRWAPTRAGTIELAAMLIPLYIAAFMEEIVMRGYVLRTVSLSWGRPAAVLLSAAAFAVLHGMNPGVSLLGLLNIGLIGVFLALTVLRTGQLWFAVGFHAAWNVTCGPLLAFPVSGMRVTGLFDTRVAGPAWLTGGSFGPEGSVATTAITTLLCLLALVAVRRRCEYVEPADEQAARPRRRAPDDGAPPAGRATAGGEDGPLPTAAGSSSAPGCPSTSPGSPRR